MGDSITQGYTAHFPSGTYPAHVAAALDAEYLNQAIGAETFHPEILDPDLSWTPDLIILAYSTNDWALKTREVFIEDATEFVRRICAIWPGKPVVMLTPTWRADYLTRRDDDFLFMDVPGIMRDIAAQFPDTQVITGIDFVPWTLKLLDDHIHPNDLGFFYYAERLVTQLKANGLA
jgi:lysophospholipase L1-like esterase